MAENVRKIRVSVAWAIVFQLIVSQFLSAVIAQDSDNAESRLDHSIDGAWERTIKTSQGEFRIEKEHNNHQTTVKIYNSDGELVQKKLSRYETNTSGVVRIFTYYDNKFVAGPGKGQIDSKERSYIYKIKKDRFFEIHGMLQTDEDDVSIIVWNRVKPKP